MARRLVLVFTVLLLAGTTASCSSDSGSGGASSTDSVTTTTAEGSADEPADAEPEAEVEPVVFEEVVPGGGCECADGSEYRYWVHEGDPTKVAFFLQGGGACFSPDTCVFEGGTYKVTVEDSENPANSAGLLDLADERNPLAGWSMVYVPYCTGDVHIGNADTDYGEGLTVHHKGSVNGTAALDGLAERFPDATEVFVTGESAGSVATPYYAGLAADRLPDARITVLADGSGAYPDVPGINAAIGALWGTQNAVPDWPTNADVTPENWSLPGLFVRAGKHDPDITFARRDFAYDETQEFFADMAGVGEEGVLGQIDANEEAIEAAGIDVKAWVSPGDEHTILSKDDVYDHEVEGAVLIDWITDLVEGTKVDDVHCTECGEPADD